MPETRARSAQEAGIRAQKLRGSNKTNHEACNTEQGLFTAMNQAGSKNSLALLPKVDTMKTSQYTAHWRTVSENVLANNHPIALFFNKSLGTHEAGNNSNRATVV